MLGSSTDTTRCMSDIVGNHSLSPRAFFSFRFSALVCPEAIVPVSHITVRGLREWGAPGSHPTHASSIPGAAANR